MDTPNLPAAEGPLEASVGRSTATVATWGIELTCHCPACGEYVDLLRYPDFWDGRQGIELCEHDTPRTTGMEVQCPECDAEFTVDCQF